jgi:hypothetical protein
MESSMADDMSVIHPQSVDLVGGQRLLLERSAREDVLLVLAADGRVTLSVHITEKGPVLRFEGAALSIQAAGELAIEAKQLRLHGQDGLALTAGGDVVLATTGDLHSHARIQNITADLGNVNVRANDDVRLNGERVMVNCT